MPRRRFNSRVCQQPQLRQQQQQPQQQQKQQQATLGSRAARKDKPVHRNAANARERTRMRVLARAFCRLKTSLPWVPPDTKLSKLDTLRLAASYIAHLRRALSDSAQQARDTHLTWPFCGEQHRPPQQHSAYSPVPAFSATNGYVSAGPVPYGAPGAAPCHAALYSSS